MIQDGYGDLLDADSMAALLDDVFPHVQKMASNLTKAGTPEWDDAVQEGMIKAWTAARDHPTNGVGYFVRAARNWILTSLSGRSTGKPRRHVNAPDAHEMSHTIYDDEGKIAFDEPVTDAYPRVEHDDVRAAVADLDPQDRDVAYGRYWLQETIPETAERTGRTRTSIESHWNRYAKPRLIEALGEMKAS
jgi:RNA polymerase sigma factor (sigma-70 family)